MLASTPISTLYSKARDHSVSPSCRNQRENTDRASLYDASRRSPLRQRPLFPTQAATEARSNSDYVSLQSPYRTPVPSPWSTFASNSHFGLDDEDSKFLLDSPSEPPSSLFPSSNARPLFTPVKHRIIDGLSATPTAESPSEALPRVSTGLKRKSVPTRQSTPLRHHSLTPLNITSTGPKGTNGLDRLAPLPAPKFPAHTPKTKKDTEFYLHHETATLTRLRISDLNESEDDFEGGDDSGCDLDDDEAQGDALFLGGGEMQMRNGGKVGAALHLAGKDKRGDEVAEAISPGGHIIKRRARTRPLSAELLDSAQVARTLPAFSVSHIKYPFSLI